jgi:hypothetical protein
MHPSLNVLRPGTLGVKRVLANYARMAQLIPSLRHLPPPSYCARVRMGRHSPYFSQPEDYGFSNIRPQSSYAYTVWMS